MSLTTASALNNRVVSFVNTVDNDYNCVICMEVADDPVRCSALCRSIFCNGCMRHALARNNSCPSCKMPTTAPALKDVLLINKILKNDVYCLNKGPNQSGDIDQHTSTDSRKRKAGPDDDKCTWTGKYDQLAAHLNQCDYGMVKCFNDGCADKVERCKLMVHLSVCVHRMANCDHCNVVVKSAAMLNHLRLQCPKVVVSCECGFECTRDALTAHRDKDCPLVEICCDVIGCDAKMTRGDYEKHQEQSASHHIRLLSAALGKSLEEVAVVKQENVRLSAEVGILQHRSRDLETNFEMGKRENSRLLTALQQLPMNPMQIKWCVTDIAAKLRESVDDENYSSSRFDVFFKGNHKLYMVVQIRGSNLGLYLFKDIILSDDKRRLDVSGSSFSVVDKAGLFEKKCTFPSENHFIEGGANWCRGFRLFLDDITPYIHNDSLSITLYLKLSDNEPLIL